jgi:hypothetical protein
MTWPLGARLVAAKTGRRSSDPPVFQDILVTKVGRKWATYVDAENPNRRHLAGRFDLESWTIDGGDYISPGRVYTDRAAYERRKRVQEAWEDMTRRVPYQAPENIAMSNVNQVRRHMGLPPWPTTADDD